MTVQQIDVGPVIREERERANLTQSELCERIGAIHRPITIGHLCNIEKGNRRPSFDLALAISEVLGSDIAAKAKERAAKL